MMTSAWVVTLILTGPLSDDAVAQMRLSPDQVRAVFQQAMTDSAKRAHVPETQTVPLLSALYREVDDYPEMSHAERARIKRHLEARLGELHLRLVVKRELAQKRRREVPGRDRQLAGGADVQAAQQLINLIQATIAPESWDVNGGEGTIRYFSPLMVLVVRQTGEVHHSVGGALRALGK